MSYPIYNFPTNSFGRSPEKMNSLNGGGNVMEFLKKYGTPTILKHRSFTSQNMNGGSSVQHAIKSNFPTNSYGGSPALRPYEKMDSLSTDDFYVNKNFETMFSNVLYKKSNPKTKKKHSPI
jgi:hypothetical protein